MKKIIAWILAATLTVTASVGMTLAYFTDRDSEANVFTVGNVEIDLNEDFNQGATLIPGVDIEKEPTITNVGPNDAWVWAQIAIPAALDNDDASQNVVHFNFSQESVAAGLWNWQGDGDWMVETVTIDDVAYKVYTVLYDTVLNPSEETPAVMTKVYMDPHVDIDPNGDWYHVEGGNVTGPYWNSTTDGAPVIYVSAYAMQTEGFDTCLAAYNAYQTQWADKGTEYGTPAPIVSSDEELDEAITNGAETIILNAGTYHMPASAKGKTLTISGSKDAIIEVVPAGQGEANGQLDYNLDGSTVTFNGVTIKTNNNTFAGYARLTGTYNNCTFEGHYSLQRDSVFTNCTFNVSGDQYNAWTWGAPNVTFNGCTFNSDGKALMLYGQADTKLTVNNCIFNDTGVLPDLKAAIEIGNDYNKSYELIVNNTTVNGYEINDKGISTGSTLWANKNSMGTDKLNVVVDGVDVY